MGKLEKIRIPLAKPIVDEEMIKTAVSVLQNEHFVFGESVFKFEEEFASYLNIKYAVSVNSGTLALFLALIALGVKGGDKVVTTPVSFVATANSIIHAGSTPIFADINMETYNISHEELRRKITDKVIAVIPVHLYGHPAEMDKILDITKEKNLFIVEDACQAHGAEYKGKKVGSIGDVGCFSFYPSKNMTVAGDGGMVVTDIEEVAQQVSKLRDGGRSSKYIHDLIGYTGRLNTVNAAIGRIQLRRLDVWNEKRRRIAQLYCKLLSDLDRIVLPPIESLYVKPVYHLYVIRTQNRDELKTWLKRCSIETGVHYPIPIHLQPIYLKIYGYKDGAYPYSEQLSRTCLSLPIYPDMTIEEVKYVSEKIHDFFKE